MEHKIVERPEMHLIGIAVNTSVQKCREVVPLMWTDFMEKANDIKKLKGVAHYGFCKPINTEECTFRYVACTEVEPDAEAPAGMEKAVLPAGKYAVFEHKGPFATVGHTYNDIYEWLPKSGLKQKTMDPWIEMYDSRSTNDANSVMELWIPVE